MNGEIKNMNSVLIDVLVKYGIAIENDGKYYIKKEYNETGGRKKDGRKK